MTEPNANQSTPTTSAIDNLASQAMNQLYVSQPAMNQPIEQIQNPIQTNIIQPPSMIPAAYLSQPQNTDINQQFVQAEGEKSQKTHQIHVSISSRFQLQHLQSRCSTQHNLQHQ
jgi:hypothetical protein